MVVVMVVVEERDQKRGRGNKKRRSAAWKLRGPKTIARFSTEGLSQL